jgi:D-alanyl-D-alanine carboxypeptidase
MPSGVTGLEDAFELIGTSAEHHLASSHAPGLALAVTDREEVLGVVCRGLADVAAAAPVRADTRFQIGSISKSFSSLIVLQEVEAGRMDLHVSVNEIVPWLELPEPFGPVTLHHLMTHTSGLLVGTEDAPTGPGVFHRLRTNPPTRPPGARYLYSNDGWKVVGACLEQVTGTPIHELIAQRVLEPLGMGRSTAAITDREYLDMAVGYEPLFSDRPVQLRHPLVPATRIVSNTADGSIVSTVLDMCAYARLVLARGDVTGAGGQPILSADAFATWTRQYVDDDDGGTYGYGWWTEDVDGITWIVHSGGMVGYTAVLGIVQEHGLACVILQNGGGGKHGLRRTAVTAVQAALSGGTLAAPWLPPDATDVPDAAAYAGTYAADDGRTFRLEPDDGGLRLSVGSVSVLLERDPLEDPTDTFLVPHESLERFPLVFGRDRDGVVVEAFHGPAWLRSERYAGPEPDPLPQEWLRATGFYRNDDPWGATLRVVARKGGLAIQWPSAASDEDAEMSLIPLEDGWFAAGSERDPRRIRFLGEGAAGKAVIAEYNGGQWFRSFEE